VHRGGNPYFTLRRTAIGAWSRGFGEPKSTRKATFNKKAWKTAFRARESNNTTRKGKGEKEGKMPYRPDRPGEGQIVVAFVG